MIWLRVRALQRNRVLRWGAALLCACAISGCSRATIDFDPGVLPGCAAGHGEEVLVSWDVPNASTKKGIQIYIKRPGAGERPWIQGKPHGSRKTGRWTGDGMTFILRDDHGRELARRTIEKLPCPREQKDE